MTASYVAYIDESGDEGFTFFDNGSGSSRWFVISALILRKTNDLQVVRTTEAIRAELELKPKYPLHFRDLPHHKRVVIARHLGGLPSRAVNVLVHKPSITEPENFQQEAYSLYRYASRLLLERVSWLCRDNRRVPDPGNGTVELIYSNRSAMSYHDLCSYLDQLRTDSLIKDVRIDWDVVKPEQVRAVNHDQLAGLQLADALAASAWHAVTQNKYGDTENRYLRLLSPIIYRHKGRCEGYGLKFWCSDAQLYQDALAATATN